MGFSGFVFLFSRYMPNEIKPEKKERVLSYFLMLEIERNKEELKNLCLMISAVN